MPQLTVGALAQIAFFDDFITDGSSCGIGTVQAVVFAADTLIRIPVQRHPQHDLFRRDSLVQVGLNTCRNAGFTLGRCGRGRIQWGVEVGVRVPGSVQIIAHKENVIYDVRYLHRLNLVEIPGAGGTGNGERISLAIPAALPVQLGAKLPEQQREVLLVRRPMDGPGRTTGDGVLPVQIHTIQAVFRCKSCTAGGKGLPPGFGGRNIRKILGIRPSAHGDQQLELRIPGPQLPQRRQILFVLSLVLQHDGPAVRIDLGKRIVDLGQFLCRNLVGCEPLVSGPPRVVAHHFPAELVCTALQAGLSGDAQRQQCQAHRSQTCSGAFESCSHFKNAPFLVVGVTWHGMRSLCSILPGLPTHLKPQILEGLPGHRKATVPAETAAFFNAYYTGTAESDGCASFSWGSSAC